MTMTSCNPMFSAAERIIAYSVFDSFYPRADGPPDEIAATVAGAPDVRRALARAARTLVGAGR